MFGKDGYLYDLLAGGEDSSNYAVTKKRTIWGAIIAAVFFAIWLYVFTPAWTFHSPVLVWGIVIALAGFGIISGNYGRTLLLAAIWIIIWIICCFTSGALFNAHAYSKILTIEEGSPADIISVEDTDHIALMDTASARRLGDREIGSLDQVVSQYNVSKSYTQISLASYPMKVAALEHAGLFKWFNNFSAGTPGYVEVDPVSYTSRYVELDHGMRYVPSSHFWQNLSRHLRGLYPTLMFDSPHFEVDEEGHPYYIAPTYDYEVGPWGGKQVTGAIICDPCTGAADWYRTGEIPQWVDYVYDGDLICKQYDWSSQYQHGWLNSWIGQRDCRKVTTGDGIDYGFLAIDDDIWVYTGVTSVNGDSSNIGFLLANQRTEETKFITQPGANEFSAMAAAQGEVQEKGYIASFPSLVKFDDELAYLMVLKDDAGLVKMCAAVDVEQYNIVAVASVQNDAVAKFRLLLAGESTADYTESSSPSGLSPQAEARDEFYSADATHQVKTVVMTNYALVTIDGDTYVYMITSDNEVYFSLFTDVPLIISIHESECPYTLAIQTYGGYFTFPY